MVLNKSFWTEDLIAIAYRLDSCRSSCNRCAAARDYPVRLPSSSELAAEFPASCRGTTRTNKSRVSRSCQNRSSIRVRTPFRRRRCPRHANLAGPVILLLETLLIFSTSDRLSKKVSNPSCREICECQIADPVRRGVRSWIGLTTCLLQNCYKMLQKLSETQLKAIGWLVIG